MNKFKVILAITYTDKTFHLDKKVFRNYNVAFLYFKRELMKNLKNSYNTEVILSFNKKTLKYFINF